MVAAGAVAKKWLAQKYGTRVSRLHAADRRDRDPVRELGPRAEQPVLRAGGRRVARWRPTWTPCARPATPAARASASRASGVPAGLGEPLFDKLDADIAYAMMGINAVKGVEIGAGFASVAQRGTTHGDSLTPQGFRTNNAGGVLGGISTGQDLEVSIAIKPTSSIITPARHHRPAGPGHAGDHQGPPRPLRRHPRHADRRSDAGAGGDGARAAPARAERRRQSAAGADRRLRSSEAVRMREAQSGASWPFAALSATYFAHIGFFNPYLPLWLKDLGLPIVVISLLASVQSFTRVFAPYAWGALSDHTRRARAAAAHQRRGGPDRLGGPVGRRAGRGGSAWCCCCCSPTPVR